jgi:hypothetical protein
MAIMLCAYVTGSPFQIAVREGLQPGAFAGIGQIPSRFVHWFFVVELLEGNGAQLLHPQELAAVSAPEASHRAERSSTSGGGGGGEKKGAKKGRGKDAGNAPLNERNFLGGTSAGVVGGVQHGVLDRDFCFCLVQLLLQLLHARLEIVDLLLLLEQQALFLGGKDGDLDVNVTGIRLKRLNWEGDLGR